MRNVSTLSDGQVVKLVREKDRNAYAEIIRRYQDKLMRYSSFMIRDKDKAADVVQDTFIKAYINLNSFDTGKKFSSWIYRIAHNESINALRRDKKHVALNEHVEFDSGVNLEDDVTREELQAHTGHCLTQMPVIYREPLTLHFLEDKTYEEISDILRIPTGTVGTRINRAKILMRTICRITGK